MAYTMAEGEAKRKGVPKRCKAGIAQLVEQLICNQQVVGSNPTAGSMLNPGFAHRLSGGLAASWRLCHSKAAINMSCAVH